MNRLFKPTVALLILVSLAGISGCAPATITEALPDTHGFELTPDIEWARPEGHSLTMDIYTPKTGKDKYPVLVIFHGGGWLINDKSPMTSMSEYIARHSEYVICNVNYRLLVDQGNSVTMDQIIEDAMGAVLWVKDHIAAYKGDPSRVMVTGDSAGGHLASMVVLCGRKLESDGFSGPTLGFKPTYLPEGQTAEQVAASGGMDLQAAILSYAAFDIHAAAMGGFEDEGNVFWSFTQSKARGLFGDSINVQEHPEYYQAVSPIFNLPDSSERRLPPHLCTVGSEDNLITPPSVQGFVNLLTENGHQAEYWEHDGRPHAFLDGGRNEFLGTEFERDAIPALERMIRFMDRVMTE
ncbi:MAG: alpha/beta hydrolase [Fidelibacterota bacterium]|nr:MAG: alpha/beta hydrolase [Candidatus Neomarinimicrobiota bacterium]